MSDEKTTCKACGSDIVQIGGGHRQRLYCNENCRQAAFRRRREEAEREKHHASLQERFGGLLPKTVQLLDTLMQYSGYEMAERVAFAINAECGRQLHDLREVTTRKIWSLQQRVSELEQELAHVQAQGVNARMPLPGTDEQFMEEGKRLGFPELHFPTGYNTSPPSYGILSQGEEFWRRFSQMGELRLVKAALEVARSLSS